MMNIKSRNSVCRSLFGPVDHDQLRLDLQLQLKEMTEQDTRRWNFNFQSETPLLGRFQWEEISAGCTGSFYQESTQLEISPPRTERDGELSEERLGTDQENCSSISNTPRTSTDGTSVEWKQLLSKPATKDRANSKITDFFAKRRRSAGTKNTAHHVHTSPTEAAQCKTIR